MIELKANRKYEIEIDNARKITVRSKDNSVMNVESNLFNAYNVVETIYETRLVKAKLVIVCDKDAILKIE